MTASVSRSELERILRQRRFDERTKEIARRLFIDKTRPKLLAVEYGLIQQRIYAIRKCVLALAMPPGEAQVTLAGPVEAIEAAQRAFDNCLARLRTDAD